MLAKTWLHKNTVLPNEPLYTSLGEGAEAKTEEVKEGDEEGKIQTITITVVILRIGSYTLNKVLPT